jgi:hypothetical protein
MRQQALHQRRSHERELRGFLCGAEKKHPKDSINWYHKASHDVGTPKEHEVIAILGNNVSALDQEQYAEILQLRAIVYRTSCSETVRMLSPRTSL